VSESVTRAAASLVAAYLPPDRCALGRAAVFSLTRAAKLLPCRESTARQLIREAGIVRMLGDKECVVWGTVLDTVLVPLSEQEGTSAPSKGNQDLRWGDL